MSTESFSIEIPTDSDEYFRVCCPYCRNNFKISAPEFRETDVINIFCPICGLVDELNSFFSDEVIKKALAIAQNYVEETIYQMFKNFERKTNGNSFFKFDAGKKPVASEPELYELDDHLTIVHKKCCDSHFKVTELDKWLDPYCVYCGRK